MQQLVLQNMLHLLSGAAALHARMHDSRVSVFLHDQINCELVQQRQDPVCSNNANP